MTSLTLKILGGVKVVTKPDYHYDVATTFWRGLGYINAETVAVFCERARFADTILDIGANWGYYTLLAGSVAPNAKIVSFEPNPFWFQELKKNVTANRFGFENIHVESFAVSDSSGKGSFYLGSTPGTSSLVKEYNKDENPTEITVERISLDEYVRNQSYMNNRQIDLIKLDVELHESAVLKGAKDTIRCWKPDIICEVLPPETHTKDIRNANMEVIQKILSEFGYEFYWISDKGLVKEDVLQGHFPLSNYLFTTCLD